MNTHELGAAVLVGDIAPSDIRRIGDDTFLQIKDFVITDEGASFTTVGGHRITVTLAPGLGRVSQILAGGGMFVIPLPGTFSKVTLSPS